VCGLFFGSGWFFFFPFRIARFSGLFLFRFVWYNVGSFSTQDLSTADRSGRSVIPSLFLVSRATARPPSSVVSHPREFHLEFFFGDATAFVGSMCRKRSDGRGGRWVRFGSIYRSECPSRPIPPFSGPTKKKEKKKKGGPTLVGNDPETFR